jgi:hypothetical protein
MKARYAAVAELRAAERAAWRVAVGGARWAASAA